MFRPKKLEPGLLSFPAKIVDVTDNVLVRLANERIQVMNSPKRS